MGAMAVCPRLLAACVGLSLSASSVALAFCRTHTEDPAAGSCPQTCPDEGLPLAWYTATPTYAFNERGFPGLSDGQLRGIFDAAFQTWQSVRCSDRSIGLQIRAKASATTLEEGPESAEPNDNVIVHFAATDWMQHGLPPHAFAITAVWFGATSGEILGADMMFNGAMDSFGDCAPDGCRETGPETDLRNVATHEIGHFLGLSHSAVPTSTMWCDAAPGELTKRKLSPDDIAGVCDIYPPGSAFMHPAEHVTHACAVSSEPASFALPVGLGAAALLGLCWRRRRRPPRA
ncbi:MAG: hypothetical protein JWN04_638 [Myxococcaceae bacterium]|nr:hypothetical protein [Myxococcaceae bacterium]